MKKLSKKQILMLHTQLIQQTGGSDGVRDYNLLDSALENPFQSFGGEELYPTIQAKAARLGYGLIKNHCMIDGNKRIGTHVMLVFLVLNGIELKYAWFGWKEHIHSVNEYVCRTLFFDNTAKYAIRYSPQMLPNMKMMYQNIVADYPDYQAKITSYVLTTIYKRIMGSNKPLFSDENVVKKIMYFLDAVFYFYSFSLSYNNTEKVISIMDVLGNQVPEEIFVDCLHKVMCDYSLSLAKANPEDIINLILLSSMYGIELPDVVERLLVDKIEKTGNPLMYAVFLQYFGYNKKKKKKFQKRVEEKIDEALSNIYKSQDFFMYRESWWLYIFSNCSLLSKSCRDSMISKLKDQKDFLEKSSSTHLAKTAKLLVIDYLLDDAEKYKFFNWDMSKEELFEYTVFTTYKRTLFNGYNAKTNVEDFDYFY